MIDAATLDFINTRADVVLGSCSAGLLPSVCWGMGCHAAAGGQRITVWVAREQAQALLADINATQAVAATFSEPSTNRTVQLKGRNARLREQQPGDAAILERHRVNMVREVGLMGFSEVSVRTVFGPPLTSLVAVEFTPNEAFEQTPGPKAGKPLGAA
jgi:hypothetical protein